MNLQNDQRRRWLSVLSFLSIGAWLNPRLAFAKKPEAMAAIAKIVGSQTPKEGRVKLVIPTLVENGNLVLLKVSVESPMTAQDYVKAIHVIAEGNPLPNIFSAFLTPRSGTANITTRVRLGESQRVWAIAQMSDGSFWQGYADTLVTLSACTESI
ncbi:SoxY-related AACIE arm protein [Polynucleobacter sp. Latsch14-2]|jgi:sulfur-oxidizing protein SoxY|uniref:SoxY-related AACIE arm protein n=1 Tax=Polynucleobacter sp. Latsch14-2 TaxID=2576920 RepID=UPI001C0D0703|nr:SoxY-related AACIE arm protein [Polynucleobacter sp. Latsch14-2]MBU3615340.1 SoxY-related AACIE arm protein [Polynucleobacter sp. Latsch14-2]